MVKCRECREDCYSDDLFDGYCEDCIPKPLCERCGEAYATFIPEHGLPPEVIATCDECAETHARYLHYIWEDAGPLWWR